MRGYEAAQGAILAGLTSLQGRAAWLNPKRLFISLNHAGA
jgi:hypothetical protein